MKIIFKVSLRLMLYVNLSKLYMKKDLKINIVIEIF